MKTLKNNLKENNNQEFKERKYYLDILRIIACVLVLITHSVGLIYNKTEINLKWYIS